ncbi:MAG: insulinase family protein [Clostridia bacterium]|nr:insulinase family protein [Clostridia bacterium]
MSISDFSSALLGERYRRIEHKSGLRIYHFPKNLSTTYALLATEYGSLDRCVSVNGVLERFPDGVAHFLEHKLFDNADGTDAFAHFSAVGADANAYTTYNRTAYLFSCTEREEEALEALLRFVTQPYFTRASVKKEQGIIAEEIRGGDDSPWERVYRNLLRAMYREHPVRDDICGTVSSIKRITPELLYRAYELFYDLSNMALVVCGCMSEEAVLAVADRVLPTEARPYTRPMRVLPQESAAVERDYTEERMAVSKPIFSIGFKDPALPDDPMARARRDFAMTWLNEILFSQSGELYEALLGEGLITPAFSYGYSSEPSLAFNCLTGESDEPQTVLARLWAYLEHVRGTGISQEAFERAGRVLYSDEIRVYDSTEEIANRMLAFVFEDLDMLSAPAWISSIRKEELEALLNDFFVRDGVSLSVILPLEEQAREEDET